MGNVIRNNLLFEASLSHRKKSDNRIFCVAISYFSEQIKNPRPGYEGTGKGNTKKYHPEANQWLNHTQTPLWLRVIYSKSFVLFEKYNFSFKYFSCLGRIQCH